MYYTGSTYDGDYEKGRLDGFGTYTLPTGTVYEGHLKDGMFHGSGQMTFTNGGVYSGRWENGRNIDGEYTFADGIPFNFNDDEWDYCRAGDRRLQPEIVHGIPPAGQVETYMRRIPPGQYDCAEGFLDPKTRVIRTMIGSAYVRVVDRDENNYAINFARKGPRKLTERELKKKNLEEQRKKQLMGESSMKVS